MRKIDRSRRRNALRLATLIQSIFPFLPGRFLNLFGLGFFTNEAYSNEWKDIGPLPRRGRWHSYWLMLDPAFSDQRLHYVRGQPGSRNITRFLQRWLKTGDTFIDVGANIGAYSLHACRLVGENGNVLAFEPNPGTFALLSAHFAINRIGHAKAFPVGLGSSSKRTTMFCATKESPLATLREVSSIHTASVRIERGDESLAFVPGSASGICKIDVEGFEFEVAKGLNGFIASHPNFIYCVEITDAWIKQISETGAQELCAFFETQGLVPHEIRDNGELTPINARSVPEEQVDIVFKRQSASDGQMQSCRACV